MRMPNACLSTEPGKGIILPRCCICQEVPEQGIRGGIRVKKNFICQNCERAIVSLTAASPEYEEILGRIKQLFE